MPHQRSAVDVFLEVQSEEAGDPDPGEWAYDECVWLGPRRMGKTTLVVPVVGHRMRKIPGGRAFATAQNRGVAVKRWREAAEDIRSSPIGRDVRVKVSQAFEEVRWIQNGSLFVPFAPNEDGLHSETPDLVFVDELWAFSLEEFKSLQDGYVPAFATTSGQAWLTSTAGTEKSLALKGVRTAGRTAVESGTQLRRAFVEFSLPDLIDGVSVDDLGDLELVEAAIRFHPAVCHVPGCIGARGRRPCPHGFTVRPAAIRTAWDSFDVESRRSSFLRAYGNRDAADESERWKAIEERVWTDQEDADGIPERARVALGVTVDPDSEDASISAGWRDSRGVMHTELLDRRVGTRWVAARVAGLVERVRPVAVGVANVKGDRDVADQLESSELEGVLRIAQADVFAADVRHRDELVAGSWLHLDPDREELAQHSGAAKAAAAAVLWRNRWVKGAAPITALTSQTLAGWAYDHRPEELGPFRIL